MSMLCNKSGTCSKDLRKNHSVDSTMEGAVGLEGVGDRCVLGVSVDFSALSKYSRHAGIRMIWRSRQTPLIQCVLEGFTPI